METTKLYKSKIDAWLIIVFTVIFLPIIIFSLYKGDWLWLVMIVPITFIIHLFCNTYYTIAGDILTVRSGFMVNITVDIMAIKKIEETNTMISSPATSLDRLEIFYNKFDSVVISPENKAGFIGDILGVNNNVEVRYKS